MGAYQPTGARLSGVWQRQHLLQLDVKYVVQVANEMSKPPTAPAQA